jgi:REP-associated tyrosine transposase
VPSKLTRYYGTKHPHFITGSCYHRLPILDTPARRDLFLEILEQTRQKHRFVVVGYVAMPEHFHLLMSEPEQGDPSVVMKVLKQEFARALHQAEPSVAQVWQRRFYDFNVWTERKRIEKLRYIHRNPVKRGLVSEPDQWAWSSFRSYADGEPGVVRINSEEWPLAFKPRPRETFGGCGVQRSPLTRNERE